MKKFTNKKKFKRKTERSENISRKIQKMNKI